MSSSMPHDPNWDTRNNTAAQQPNLRRLSNNAGSSSPFQPNVSVGDNSFSHLPQDPNLWQPADYSLHSPNQTHLNPRVAPKNSYAPSSNWTRTPPTQSFNYPQQQQRLSYPPQPSYIPPQSATIYNPPPPQTPPNPYSATYNPNVFSDDSWGWGWDDSQSNEANATAQDSSSSNYNPVKNYFQQPAVRDSYAASGSALTVENVAEVTVQSASGGEVRNSKPESVHSYASSLSSGFKHDRTSPVSTDPNKIPLTTQALRDFHQEAFANGPANGKSDALTPQWSIESQLSQDTVSDAAQSRLADVEDDDDKLNPDAVVSRFSHLYVTDSGNREIVPPTEISGESFYSSNAHTRGTNLASQEDTANLETLPENKERPDIVDLRGVYRGSERYSSSTSIQKQPTYQSVSENQEVAPRCGPDRNQYLETGQLLDSGPETDMLDLPPPGLSRLVTGEGRNDLTQDVSTPPPGLDRMIPGQLNEGERMVPGQQNVLDPVSQPPLLRMVLGHTSETTLTQSPIPSSTIATAPPSRPPNVLHRMVPGESNSAVVGNVGVQPTPANCPPVSLSLPTASPMAAMVPTSAVETRVVTGDEKIGLGAVGGGGGGGVSPVNRKPSPVVTPEVERSRGQPQTERSETIGSDHVETYSTNLPDSAKSSNSKRRERDLRREEASSEDERESTDRRPRDSEYRDYRDESPSVSERTRRSGDWDRRRRDSPQRRRRDDRRRRRDYDYSDDDDVDDDDDDVEGSGYYSDRERRSGYDRSGYDRTFPRREDRARSLRPEKNRTYRGRDRRRYDAESGGRDRDRDERHSEYYRRRGHNDSNDFQRSRPSTRNDSPVHDFKRRDYDRDLDRDRDYRSKRERDYHGGGGGGGSSSSYYPSSGYNYDYYYYQYYENLRRTNPVAYAELVRKYYASSQQGTYTEDRGSVHSGRSSVNEDQKDRGGRNFGLPSFQSSPLSPRADATAGRREESSLQLEDIDTQPQRLTPAKFTTAHVKGVLTVRGQLLKIPALYPLDGQLAMVEIYENIPCIEEIRKELQDFPGPLVKNVTHKNNVVRYCKQKIKEADMNATLFDKESYKLIWELLILLLRQNGTVVGTDIAELLMNQRSAKPGNSFYANPNANTTPSPATSHHSINELSAQQPHEEEVTNRFRDLLICGNTKEALEWAMKHGLWGHALFLASKMDQRTYASVMTRFANGLALNDPLQTLYQLMSGRQPAAVTCCADEKWGDWRPHLAMILSNPSGRPELDHRAITTLGDTLAARGCLYAAHFCYLMAQVGFGSYAHKSSKLVLIGSSHHLPFMQFATNKAIFATEIFEFACNLADSDFILQHLQIYKLLMARRLAEVGLLQEAVHYVEVISSAITKQPGYYGLTFIQQVYELGNMLKFHDPVYVSSENSGNDPDWLSRIACIINDYQSGAIQLDGYGGSISNLTTYSETDGIPNLPQDPVRDDERGWLNNSSNNNNSKGQQQASSNENPYTSQDGTNQPLEPLSPPPPPPPLVPFSQPPSAVPYWNPSPATPSSNQWHSNQPPVEVSHSPDELPEGSKVSQPNSFEYFDISRSEVSKPSISLPASIPTNTSNSRQRTTSQSSESHRIQSKTAASKKESASNSALQGASGGWFGGLWNKLAMRPKNQMILPDDKNPSIVWDSEKKRWVNLDGDEANGGGPPPPPPAISRPLPAPSAGTEPPPLLSNKNGMAPLAAQLPPPSGPNMYKMTRGKSLRANYVDVMNPGNSKPSSAPPVSDLFPSANYPNAASPPPANLFVPQPIDGDSSSTPYMPSSSEHLFEQQDYPSQGLSRCSSTSSLSREVQKYNFSKNARTIFNGKPLQSLHGNGTVPTSSIKTKRVYK